MAANAIGSLQARTGLTTTTDGSTCSMSGSPPEQPGWPDQQYDGHDDEDYRVRGLGKKHLGQPFDNAEPEAGNDGAHDRAHAADHHDREHHDDEVGTHLRADVVDRRGHDAGERRKRHAKAIGQSDHAWHIGADGAYQRGVLGGGAEIGAELGALDHEPGGQTYPEGEDDHPGPVVRKEHETEVLPALQQVRDAVGQARGAEIVAKNALNDKRQAEGEQQPVEMIELVQPLQKEPLDHDATGADHDGRHNERGPVVEADILQQEKGHKGAHHVLGAMGEIDDVEHAEDHGQPEAQQCIERAVDQPEQKLPKQNL